MHTTIPAILPRCQRLGRPGAKAAAIAAAAELKAKQLAGRRSIARADTRAAPARLSPPQRAGSWRPRDTGASERCCDKPHTMMAPITSARRLYAGDDAVIAHRPRKYDGLRAMMPRASSPAANAGWRTPATPITGPLPRHWTNNIITAAISAYILMHEKFNATALFGRDGHGAHATPNATLMALRWAAARAKTNGPESTPCATAWPHRRASNGHADNTTPPPLHFAGRVSRRSDLTRRD